MHQRADVIVSIEPTVIALGGAIPGKPRAQPLGITKPDQKLGRRER